VFDYSAYNLGISSALPLPELQTSAGVPADVTIRVDRLSWSPPADAVASEELYFEVEPAGTYFFWEQLGKFRVARGTEIILDPLPGVEERLLRLPLLGTLLAVLLHQRGCLVLHASAVAIDGEAIVFVGNKEHGKSTMAATLYGRGHQLIADDVVALSIDGRGHYVVMPGFPQFKLYPEAAFSSLGDGLETLLELAEGYEKRARPVTDRFAETPLPLRNVYVLGRGPVSTLKQLDSQNALLSIIANSYMSRFGRHLLKGAGATAHLRQCAQLVSHVAVCRLERPSALPLLSEVAQMIEDHLTAPSSTSGSAIHNCKLRKIETNG